MTSVGIVAGRDNERAQALAAELQEVVTDAGATAILDEETGRALERPGEPVAAMAEADLLVSLGGDGTLLFAAREAGDVPVVGVNLGEVGFLNAVDPEAATAVVADLLAELEATGTVPGEDRLMVRASGDGWRLAPALNEVAVLATPRGPGGGGRIQVAVDGRPYAAGPADGVMVATPTGSTAYGLAEGGPILEPGTGVCCLVPMAGTDRPPLVLGADRTVTVAVEAAPAAHVIGDGRNRRRLEPPATVRIRAADRTLRLAGPPADRLGSLSALE